MAQLDAVPFDGRSPAMPAARTQRVLVEMLRPSLGEMMSKNALKPADQRAYVDSLRREQFSLRGSLKAKDISFADITVLTRVWNGFAATVSTKDLPKLQTAGVTARPVRRFYPATARPAPAAGDGDLTAEPESPGAAKESRSGRRSDPSRHSRSAQRSGQARPSIALLDTGVDSRALRRGRGGGRNRPIVGGFDAVDGDSDPAPDSRWGRLKSELHGTELAALLTGGTAQEGANKGLASGGGLYVIRIAGPQPDPAVGRRTVYATTDQLLAGLERAVDPNADGAVNDSIGVAVIGVNAPFVGFDDSPEANAVAGAQSLGTLVVAPAGNEAATGHRFGSVGSPGAAPAAIAVGGLDGSERRSYSKLGLAGKQGVRVFNAVLMTSRGSVESPMGMPAVTPLGPSQAAPRAPPRHRARGTRVSELTGVDGRSKVSGTAVVVERRGAIGAQLAAAQAGGARLVVVCDPRDGAVLPPVSADLAQMPVVGLVGAAARDALRVVESGDVGRGKAFLGMPRSTTKDAPRTNKPDSDEVAEFSSRGPSYGFTVKPDLVARAEAQVDLGGRLGGRRTVRGTSVSAARAGAVAAAIRQEHPDWSTGEAGAAMVEGALPLKDSTPLESGAGRLDLGRATNPVALVEPRSFSLGLLPSSRSWRRRVKLRVLNTTNRTRRLAVTWTLKDLTGSFTLVADPAFLDLKPGRAGDLSIHLGGRARSTGFIQGYIELADGADRAVVPFDGYVGKQVDDLLSKPTLVRRGGRIRGASFIVGRLKRSASGLRVAIEPVERLELELVKPSGRLVRVLTPPDGALDLLPGEYAYTLDKATLGKLPGGRYKFTARAVSPDGGPPRVRSSKVFILRKNK